MSAKTLKISYDVWKSVVEENSLVPHFHEDDGTTEQGSAYAGTDEYIYITRIVDETWADFDATFPAGTRVAVARRDDAVAKIVGLSDIPRRPRRSPLNQELVELSPPVGKRLDFISINWCDRTTWYPESVQVVDETLTDSGDGLTYDPAIQRPWIDMMHAKITGERKLRSKYQIVVEVDAIAQVEDSPGQNDNDFTIDYRTGRITFNASQSGKAVVVKSYYYENGSCWSIIPAEGKVVRLTYVEVQFSDNIELKDTIIFEPYGPVEYYAPQYLNTADPPGPYPAGTMIPLGQQTVYQSMQDFINEAEESYPSIPTMGGSGFRGMKGPQHIFRWPYEKRGTTDITAASKVEIRVRIEGDTEFGGDIAIASFYGKSENA